MNPAHERMALQRVRMREVLFWLFVVIFAATAILAVCTVVIVIIDPGRATKNDAIVAKFAWALWGSVLAEVTAGIVALWKNVFGLSSDEEAATAQNIIGEIIDGFEADEVISEENAEKLREQYSTLLGRSIGKPVLEAASAPKN